jgi:hypothetical protein
MSNPTWRSDPGAASSRHWGSELGRCTWFRSGKTGEIQQERFASPRHYRLHQRQHESKIFSALGLASAASMAEFMLEFYLGTGWGIPTKTYR